MPSFTSDNWSNTAAEYRKIGELMQKSGPLNALLEQANDYLPFSQATAILDNGCGPAPVTAQIITKYDNELSPSCRLTACDYSKGMIDEVVKRRDEAADGSTWKKVKSLVQDATDLNAIEDTSQSHVLANMVYFMTPDPFKCLTESRRVLTEGGVLSLTSMEFAQWIETMNEFKKVRPDLDKPLIAPAWRDKDLLQAELERASFRDVKVERAEMIIQYDTYESQINKLWAMAVMQETRAQMSEEEWKQVMDLSKKKMAEYCPTEPGTLKGSILVATVRK